MKTPVRYLLVAALFAAIVIGALGVAVSGANSGAQTTANGGSGMDLVGSSTTTDATGGESGASAANATTNTTGADTTNVTGTTVTTTTATTSPTTATTTTSSDQSTTTHRFFAYEGGSGYTVPGRIEAENYDRGPCDGTGTGGSGTGTTPTTQPTTTTTTGQGGAGGDTGNQTVTVTPTTTSGQGGAGPGNETGEMNISILAPSASANLTGPNATVSVLVTNFTLVDPLMVNATSAPGQGHVHYFLDVTPPTTPGEPARTGIAGTVFETPNTTIEWANLTPGWHTMHVMLVNNDHSPIFPAVTDSVTFQVENWTNASTITGQTGMGGNESMTDNTTAGNATANMSINLVAPNGTSSLSGRMMTVTAEVAGLNLTDPMMVGMTPAPGEGHIHYFLDAVPPTTPGVPAILPVANTYFESTNTTIAWANVTPGWHTIYALLVNNDYTPVTPIVVDSATFLVGTETTSMDAGAAGTVPAGSGDMGGIAMTMQDDANATETNTTSGSGEQTGNQTIVEIASGNPEFSTLVTAVQAAGLVDTLNGPGPFTVFAPTNAAFDALPDGTLDALLANTTALTSVLTYHVVSGRFEPPTTPAMAELVTVDGRLLSATVDQDGNVRVNGVNVVQKNIQASNGVIHVIDAVLIPPGMGEAGQETGTGTPTASPTATTTGGQGGSGDGGSGGASTGQPGAEPGEYGCGQGWAYFDRTPGNQGGAFREDDVDIENGGSGYVVAYVKSSEWLIYTVDIRESGEYDVTFRVASPWDDREIWLWVDGVLKAQVKVPNTGSFDSYEDVTETVNLDQGNHYFRIQFVRDAQNFDYMTFERAGESGSGSGGSEGISTTTTTTMPTTTATSGQGSSDQGAGNETMTVTPTMTSITTTTTSGQGGSSTGTGTATMTTVAQPMTTTKY